MADEKTATTVVPPEQKAEDWTPPSKDQWEQTLKSIASLETAVSIMKEARENESELGEPGEPEPDAAEEKDLSGMSPQQFYDHIVDTVGKPVMTAVLALQVTLELDAAKRGHEDFKDYERDVQKACEANPRLSVEDAYVLVKAKKQGKEPPKPEVKPEPLKPKGEKPGVEPSTLKQGSYKTVREAAIAAAKELSLEVKE